MKKFIAVLCAFLMLGCTGEKYHVDYHGAKQLFKGAKDSYTAGKKVTMYYDMIATDTDYTFYLDEEVLDADYGNKGYIISFVMPDHDISITYDAVNSMTAEEQE